MTEKYYSREKHGYMLYSDDVFASFLYSIIERPAFCHYGSAIEVGAGMGRFSSPLLEHFPDITLIEPEPSFVQCLREKFGNTKARILELPGERALSRLDTKRKSIVFCFHLMHHLQLVERACIYKFVRETSSLCVLVEPNPINPLILLQVLTHPDMRFADEIQYLSFGRRWYRKEIESFGLTVLDYRRVCLLPPFLANYALHKIAPTSLAKLERLAGVLPFLASYQLIIYGTKESVG